MRNLDLVKKDARRAFWRWVFVALVAAGAGGTGAAKCAADRACITTDDGERIVDDATGDCISFPETPTP